MKVVISHQPVEMNDDIFMAQTDNYTFFSFLAMCSII